MGIGKYLLTSAAVSTVSAGVAISQLPKDVKLSDLGKIKDSYQKLISAPEAHKLLRQMILEDGQLNLTPEEIAKLAEHQKSIAESLAVLQKGQSQMANADSVLDQTKQETVGTVIDANSLEAIEQMNIPDSMKNRLRAMYMQTGEVPGLNLKKLSKSNKPEAKTASAESVEIIMDGRDNSLSINRQQVNGQQMNANDSLSSDLSKRDLNRLPAQMENSNDSASSRR
jgi:hypothetical protein